MVGPLKIGAVAPALTSVENLKGTVIMIMNALEFLHQNSVMHRDLNPSNVVFDSTGYLRLIDFGYARVW